MLGESTFFAIFWRRFRRNRLALTGGLIVTVFTTLAILAPVISPHDPRATNMRNRLQPPSQEHLLGTDSLGRDLLSRTLHAGRISLMIAVLAVGMAMTIGVVVGSIAGYFGGLIDSLLMRLVDLVLSFPTLYLLITLVALLGPSIYLLVLVMGSLGWTDTARIVRAEFLRLREQEFSESARALGAGDLRIVFRHLLPNATPPVIVAISLGVPGVILGESALSFLGLGVVPPQMSWGSLVNAGLPFFRVAWWLPIFPGAAIFLYVLAFNFLGDGLRDALDPRSSRIGPALPR